MASEYFLEMHDINKTFPGAKVLDSVHIEIKAGEVRALMGENGAGKSTLIKILGGIHEKDEGTGSIRIAGKEVTIRGVQSAKAHGISIIHQEICLAENMSVADNLFMGAEITGNTGVFLNDKEMVARAQGVLDSLGMQIDARVKVGELSIAKQQMVEISRALLSNARLIVMDEPTSSLTNIEIEQLFAQIHALKSAGIAIIYISHRMDEIFRIADSVTVLRDGQLIGTEFTKNLTQDAIISMMVGRKISEIYDLNTSPAHGAECLRVKGFQNKKLRNIDFCIHKGEILGFSGLVGAGRTELARAIFGIDKLEAGELYLDGKKARIDSPREAIRHGIGYVPESRKTEGLFLQNPIRYNITISVLEQFIRFIRINRNKEKNIVDDYANRLAIKMTSTDQLVRYLSGGNQQKVVVSKWLATNPNILILDEPTRGIDIGAKSEIYHLISELAAQGMAILLISSEMEEIINLSHRIIVMCEGRISGELRRNEMELFSQERIMQLASGGINGEQREA